QTCALPIFHALRRAQDTRAGDPSELLEMRLGSRVEGDRSEAPVGGGDEERADRGVDDVDAEVDELQRESRVANATVEVGGDGHSRFLLLRSLRTPGGAAC